ncbi:hypothetical protein [Marinactinospora rubrisoli]|uniref:Antitoxin n=1 Tax=Marinactinospora rubrisoli TaxID=2715399 RepID=A0ABW2KCB0_9ACTN
MKRDPDSAIGAALRRIEAGEDPGDFTATLRKAIQGAKDEKQARAVINRIGRKYRKKFPQ